MGRGRKTSGPDLVDGLLGSAEAKKRLKVILETITGRRTIADACRELVMNEAAFHKLRERTLGEAVEGLEPRPLGRPKKEEPPEVEKKVEALEEENAQLRLELKVAEVREEMARTLPYVLRKRDQKKT
jgi:hypothetical protein